ncbi:MAG: arsenosugar biosynthesis radical SAM protein ArsS [Nitrospinae bacterium]|nr:arsenosugar biosynthesis radical SAM protein ArsS [Nitrospinota bacterium]
MNKPDHLRPFDDSLTNSGLYPLTAAGIRIFQVNVGRLCNQSCKHCHVDAGPGRKEVMQRDIMDACIGAVEKSDISTIDITGGAPEMNPHLLWLIKEFNRRNRHVMVRSNLTILSVPEYESLPEFFAENRVEITASLPHYIEQTADRQRGAGIFRKSIETLKKLNCIGYGKEGSGLILNLVYNPAGAFLPPSQKAIEGDYKREMLNRYRITFNNLYTITNMPIGRFLNYLKTSENYDDYMQKLINSYNLNAASQVMCRYTLSVGWDGTLYDCDFNQMLGMAVNHGAPSHINGLDLTKLYNRRIVTGLHCYGCTAGAGSSCGGAVI